MTLCTQYSGCCKVNNVEERINRGDPSFVPKWMQEGKESWTSKKICGGATRNASPNGDRGHPCQRPAGWGTDHPGYGHCKLHGGALPNGGIYAAKEQAMEEVQRVMGPGIEIEPMDALLMCVKLAAGEVAYATWKIDQLSEDEAVGQEEVVSEHEATSGEKMEGWIERSRNPVSLNIWIRTRRESMDRLAKYSKMALDAGVAERQVRMAEAAADELALAVRDILDGLGLTVEQERKAPDIVRAALVKLERAQIPETVAA